MTVADLGSEPARWRARAAWQLVAAAATTVVMGVVYLWDRSFYFVDGRQNAYLPVAMDIGRRITSGDWPPVTDPLLGRSGIDALDLQYGVFEPTHWLAAVALSRFSSLQLAAFVWAVGYAVLLAVGTTALAQRLRMPGPWAALAGVAVSTSGWVLFWLGPHAMPGLVSLAWLPWLWWAWVGLGGRVRVRDCVALAGFGYLVVASGWPSTWLALGALLAGLVTERLLGEDVPGVSARARLEPLAVRALATLAGVGCAVLCLLPLYHAPGGHEAVRGGGLANDNFLIANGWDIVSFAAPQLTGDIVAFGGSSTFGIPVFFVGWFGVVVLWSLRWDRNLGARPGLVTALTGGAVMLLLTQAPSDFGPFHDQIRQLGGVQLFFVVGVCALGSSTRWVVSRTRVAGIVGTLAAMGWVSWSRTPHGPGSVTGILVVGAAAGLLLLVLLRRPRLVAVAALVGTAGLALVAFGLYHAGSDGHAPASDDLPGHRVVGAAGSQVRLSTRPLVVVPGVVVVLLGGACGWVVMRRRAQPAAASAGVDRDEQADDPGDGDRLQDMV